MCLLLYAGLLAAEPTYRNPILNVPRAADPAVLRYEGVYYLYPTLDGKGYEVWSSTDLVHWERHPYCYRDARGGVWAPDLYLHTDGRIYLYYTVDNPAGGKLIGVAEGTHPLGPFEDRGVLLEGAIDAHVFRDDDGQLYLYYANLRRGFGLFVQRLADPLTKLGEPIQLTQPDAPWEQSRGRVNEGPWLLKRRGVYYLMYSGSHAAGPDYAIGYATATSPIGPFTKYPGNPIAKAGNGIWGPGHHCVVEGPRGGLWLVYHQKNTDKFDWDRFLALDPLWFDDEGVLHCTLSRGTDQPAP